jgi:hypothetical protein
MAAIKGLRIMLLLLEFVMLANGFDRRAGIRAVGIDRARTARNRLASLRIGILKETRTDETGRAFWFLRKKTDTTFPTVSPGPVRED